jgi:hypothetical protein
LPVTRRPPFGARHGKRDGRGLDSVVGHAAS